MMKKKVMPLSCLMAAAMLAGCGTAAPAVSEKTTAPAAETAEAAQKTAPADAAESEAAAMEETAGVWKVEPCYNFDEIVPLYSEWDHTAGKNASSPSSSIRRNSSSKWHCSPCPPCQKGPRSAYSAPCPVPRIWRTNSSRVTSR